MIANRCKCCQGSGKMMGGGMITKDCDACDGSGKLPEPVKINYKAAKKTNGYKSAKNRLKAQRPDLTDDEIDSILSEELEKEVNK